MFRFEAKWCLDSSFEDVVRSSWNDMSGSVPNKLERLGSLVQRWSRSRINEKRKNRVDLEDRLKFLFNQEPDDEILGEIIEVQRGLNLEADKEELFWEQRARVNWLKNGDRNTSFFHKIVVQRHFLNRIAELDDGNRRRFSSTEDLLCLASDYFKDLYSASEIGSDEHVFGLVENRVSGRMNDSLLKQFTEEDISLAIKMMEPLKAPGVDGFPVLFFQRYWHIIGSDISSYCFSILSGETKIVDINKTRIVLIPKVEKPKNLSQFKPISLCNVIYKIIAKVLVN